MLFYPPSFPTFTISIIFSTVYPSAFLSILPFLLLPSFQLYSIPSPSSEPPTLFPYHLSFVHLRSCIRDSEGCFACHTVFASPFPSSYRENKRQSEEEKHRVKTGGIGWGQERNKKGKITPLPGLMNIGKGQSQ